MAWTHAGLAYAGEESPSAFQDVSRRLHLELRAARVPQMIRAALARAALGRCDADVPIDLTWARDFERDVLLAARRIPRGQTRPYRWLARQARRPLAVRAAASAIAKNPLWLLVPCHRVVYADGTLGPYGSDGNARKRELLKREGVDLAARPRALQARS
ncbi:MAG: methylated-DNA--[protein]-cysteine S-methyltransferase [Candidatus Eremiobacteraeota bacterium]|nr:methylated-DNA--[protein]-cysteine S-methyltransferase [Candidatus Eremiobacteraeota bacterium]